jgi:ATP-binding protein involved in chromosome partitioning
MLIRGGGSSYVDPRLAVIEKRLAGIRRIVAVSGGKGGIGKSVVASTLALTLADAGRRAGLLDLDLTGPCAHVIIGAEQELPEEKWGIEPPDVHGVRFISISYFVGPRPARCAGPT